MTNESESAASPLEGVGATAVAVAVARELESQRDDRVLFDPLAAEFVTATGEQVNDDHHTMSPAARETLISMQYSVVGRTRFLDDVCAAALADGVEQVVILGAGLDTRGFRLGWPTTVSLFEVDRRDVFTVKEPVIAAAGRQPSCRRLLVVADLREQWTDALRAAGFDEHRPTVWLAEGLLVYLDTDIVVGLLAAVTAASPTGSRFGVTLRTELGEQHRDDPTADPYAEYHSLWRSFGTIDVVDWLNNNGWDTSTSTPRETLLAQGRNDAAMPAHVDQPLLVHASRAS